MRYQNYDDDYAVISNHANYSMKKEYLMKNLIF